MHAIVHETGGIREISMGAALAGKRVACIIGEIKDELAVRFVESMMYFCQEDAKLPVKVFLHSPGGYMDSGMMIYDAIQTAGLPVEVCCIGEAYSMAALILSCGTHGRYILPHGRVMLHEPMVSCEIGGKSSSLQAVSDALLRRKQEMNGLLAKHTGQSVETLSSITSAERFFTAQEAVEFGLADGIKGLGEMMQGTQDCIGWGENE